MGRDQGVISKTMAADSFLAILAEEEGLKHPATTQ
jgi:hypothetical protein